jgi:hypothetical protein
MSTRSYTTNVGDLLVIGITGTIGRYIAEVIQTEPLRLKVEESGQYANLKDGDFIVNESKTLLLQQDAREDTTFFLQQEQKAGRKVVSGLAALGVEDGKLHEIFP